MKNNFKNMTQKRTTKQETPEQKAQREMTESIAKNLNALAESVKNLVHGPLKRKTILILLAHSTGLPQRDIDAVLVALTTLPKDFLN